jgi:signal transduction histidine kinase
MFSGRTGGAPGPAQDANVRHSLAQLAQEARARAWLQRLVLQLVIAFVAAYWIGYWSLAWLAAIQVRERLVGPILTKAIDAWQRKSDGPGVRWARAAVLFLDAAIFATIWAFAWAVGGDAAGFFAGVMMCAAIIYALVYFSNSRLSFYASIAPPMLAAFAVTAFKGFEGAHILVVPVLALILLRAHWAQRDQLALFASVDRNRTLRMEAEDANRAKTVFLAAITHELRTPLNAVLNYSEMLQEELAASQAHLAADAARIRSAGQNLLGIVDAVLDFVMTEAGDVVLQSAEVDVASLIGAEVSRVQAHADQKAVSIAVSIEPDAKVMITDGEKLRRCVSHLLGNAVRFTESGRIAVECSRVHRDGALFLQIAVADTGRGMDQETLAKLFKPFSQADGSRTRANDGMGLGLALSRGLARALGGDLTVTSTLGAGSRFVLTVAAPARVDPPPVLARA